MTHPPQHGEFPTIVHIIHLNYSAVKKYATARMKGFIMTGFVMKGFIMTHPSQHGEFPTVVEIIHLNHSAAQIISATARMKGFIMAQSQTCFLHGT